MRRMVVFNQIIKFDSEDYGILQGLNYDEFRSVANMVRALSDRLDVFMNNYHHLDTTGYLFSEGYGHTHLCCNVAIVATKTWPTNG